MTPLDVATRQTPQELTQAKLSDLRSLMNTHQLNGYFIPAVDEHLSLSLPPAKQRRAWVSGFTGSAGDLLLTHKQAWLFVDSRYHERADLEVSPLIRVSKLGLPNQLTLLETLENLAQQQPNFRLGFDPFTLSAYQFNEMFQRLSPLGGQLVPLEGNLVDVVRHQSPWNQLDPIPAYGQSSLFCLPESLTGETTPKKLHRVRQVMEQETINLLPITNLNQVAWLFNLRGGDIPYVPLLIAYAVITPDEAFLFTNLERIEEAIQLNLQQIGVTLKPYEQYKEMLQALVSQLMPTKILIDPKHTSMGTYYQLIIANSAEEAEQAVQIAMSTNPIEGMKARKNAVEIEQMRLANFKASRAKVRTLAWLESQLSQGVQLSEVDVANTIEQFYQAESDFHSLSFKTISGAGANSSIVHYGTPSPTAFLKPSEFLLLDSGVQYLGGTTDDTRTVMIGEPTPLQISRYTAVLMAHINCASLRFPKGTTGIQLDAIARSALWQEQLNYGHGTGHGVGAFLSGHEGPNGISPLVEEPFVPGMITSIEPGYYEPGWGGIRLENLYVVKEVSTENGVTWYGFEPLTYIPFDKRLIDFNRLSLQQRDWLESYHQKVLDQLSPSLDTLTAEWLQTACRL